MNKAVFRCLKDGELGSACFAPIIPMIRGKNNEVKQQVYKQLSSGQKALFMFYVYYNHASRSVDEFYWWSAYYFAQPKAWSEIKIALSYFQAESMLKVFEEIEELLTEQSYPRSLEEFNLSTKDLVCHPDLFLSIQSLNDKFNEVSSVTLNQIGVCIRNDPSRFIHIED